MGKFDIKVTKLKQTEMDGYKYSKLELRFAGKDINESIINAIRRTSYMDIPTYAYCDQSINIEYNDTIFNNDYMRLRISQLPILNIDNDIVFLPSKYWHEVNYSDIKRDKHPHDKLSIELYINAHNDKTSNINITTDNIRLYIDGNEVKNMYKKIHPILLIQLRPNQTFKMNARGVLGIGERNNIWSAASNAYYEYNNPHDIKFTIESQGQMTEMVILQKAVQIIKKRLDDIAQKIKETHKNIKQNIVEIVFTGEDHTIGNIINDGLQEHPDVISSGLAKPDLLIKEIKLKFMTDKDPIKCITDVIQNKVALFDEIEKQLK